jgi:hypothetical protein
MGSLLTDETSPRKWVSGIFVYLSTQPTAILGIDFKRGMILRPVR